MAMVAAALGREGMRFITVQSSILKCMNLARINDRSYTNQFNLKLQRTAPSTGSLSAYKKPGAGYYERCYTSASKCTTSRGDEANTTMEEETETEQSDDDESSYIAEEVAPIRIGGTLGAKAVSILFHTGASHSVINAQTAKALCLETKPTPPTTVTMGLESYNCDTKCVIDWEMHNLQFTWTFLVMPLAGKWDIILGVDYMKQVSPLRFNLVRRSIIISMPDGPYELREDGSSTKLKVFPGYSKCTSAAKFTTACGEEAKAEPGDDESIRQTATPFGMGGVLFCTGESRSFINARHINAQVLETEYVIDFQGGNLMFTWIFHVMPSDSKWNMILGADFMKRYGPLVFDFVEGPISISMPHGPYVLGNCRFNTEAEAKAKQVYDEPRDTRKEAHSFIIGGKFGPQGVSILFRSEASHSVIKAETVKEMCLETKPTPPTTVTIGSRESVTCDTKCVINWQMNDLKFTWTFLVMPLGSYEFDIILGADWMEHVSFGIDLVRGSGLISMPDGAYELREDGSSTKLKVFPPDGSYLFARKDGARD